jgi:hypothetical protein
MWLGPAAGALTAGTAAWLAAIGSADPGALGGTVAAVFSVACVVRDAERAR